MKSNLKQKLRTPLNRASSTKDNTFLEKWEDRKSSFWLSRVANCEKANMWGEINRISERICILSLGRNKGMHNEFPLLFTGFYIPPTQSHFYIKRQILRWNILVSFSFVITIKGKRILMEEMYLQWFQTVWLHNKKHQQNQLLFPLIFLYHWQKLELC